MKKSTFDVTYGPSGSLIVTTDKDAAARIATAIEKERAHLFQMEGLSFGVKETDRGYEVPDEVPEADKKARK